MLSYLNLRIFVDSKTLKTIYHIKLEPPGMRVKDSNFRKKNRKIFCTSGKEVLSAAWDLTMRDGGRGQCCEA